MTEIMVPRENINDETVRIVKLFYESGSNLKKGDVIVEIETSKSIIDVESTCNGVLIHNLNEGDDIEVGSVLCSVVSNPNDKSVNTLNNDTNKIEAKKAKTIISKAALKRASELNIDLSEVNAGILNVADVEQMAMEKAQISENYTEIEKLDILDNSIVIIGGGGHAKMCIDLIRQNNEYNIIGIIDEKLDIGSDVLGIKVIGDNGSLIKLRELGVKFAINGVGAISKPKVRLKIYKDLKNIGFIQPNLIHPSSSIEPSASLGDGNQIMMGAYIGSDVKVGHGCIINSGSIISHDCILRDHCHIAPGAILAGSVDVGYASVIGMGVTVYLGISIGDDVLIYNGVNITKNIKNGEIVDGN